MTAHLLQTLVTEALAEIGLAGLAPERGRVCGTRWLPDAHGIGVRHYASGRSVYVVQSRMNGTARLVTIGPASVISEAQAIAVARRVLAHALVGNNPAETRKRVRAAPIWADYIEQYWHAASPRWKPSTRKAHNIYRRLYLDAAFAEMTIDSIGEPEVTRWFAKLTRQCGPDGANRCISILNAMMMKAEAWGHREAGSNPCRCIKRNRARKLERHLSAPELARLGAALATERDSADPMRRNAVAIITLLLLTGCRSSEIRNLRWSDVHGPRVKVADAKAGPRIVWLGEDARRIIDELPRLPRTRWLFPGKAGPISKSRVDTAWFEIRATADLKALRLHDLRHTFASHAAQNAETLPMISKLLGHANLNSTARYAHLDDADLINRNEQIGERLAHLLAASQHAVSSAVGVRGA